MSISWGQPWSDNPNAPRIPPWLYSTEKEEFAGHLISAILYGIVVILFFQCIGALISPANNIRRSIKWGLVVHTVALFLFLTIPTAMDLYIASIGFVDNRNFPGTDKRPPGPLGCELAPNSKAVGVVFSVMFRLNQWLADGLLLYRCYIIYYMNHWAMAFPCLMYLASIVIGITHVYARAMSYESVTLDLGTSYYSISFSLSVLLTLMIIVRLILHHRDIRNAIGTSDAITGLYTTVVTMLIESYALYAAGFLLYMVPWATGSSISSIFDGFVGATQVIAPYLIIIRVAKRRALTSDVITSGSGNVGSVQFRGRGVMHSDGSLLDGAPGMRPVQEIWEVPYKVGGGTGSRIEEAPL